MNIAIRLRIKKVNIMKFPKSKSNVKEVFI